MGVLRRCQSCAKTYEGSGGNGKFCNDCVFQMAVEKVEGQAPRVLPDAPIPSQPVEKPRVTPQELEAATLAVCQRQNQLAKAIQFLGDLMERFVEQEEVTSGGTSD